MPVLPKSLRALSVACLTLSLSGCVLLNPPDAEEYGENQDNMPASDMSSESDASGMGGGDMGEGQQDMRGGNQQPGDMSVSSDMASPGEDMSSPGEDMGFTDPEMLEHFVVTWKVSSSAQGTRTLTIPAGEEFPHNYDVDWDNDGVFDSMGVTGDATHDYDAPGRYTIRIRGQLAHLNLSKAGFDRDLAEVVEVHQWGNIPWRSMSRMFYGCQTMRITATDAPDLSRVTDMSDMFLGAFAMNAPLNHWDVSNVQNMHGLFSGATSFNQPLDGWDVSNVTDMSEVFNNAEAFNQDISGWNTSKVTTMNRMFARTDVFDQPIGVWDVSQVTDLEKMFLSAAAFNQPLGAWNTANVTNMTEVFNVATVFNQPLNTWNTSKVTNMQGMFDDATAFNQPLDSWDTSQVTDMHRMFQNATSFDQDIGMWNIRNLGKEHGRTMAGMLENSGLSQANYDKALIGWADVLYGDVSMPPEHLPEMPRLDADGLTYCDGEAARMILESNGWEINEDMKVCR